jgi:hypothetical protein
MFGWLRRRRLQQQRRQWEQSYRRLLEQARDQQRQGDIQGFAATTAAAAELERRLDAWDRVHPTAVPGRPVRG